MCTIINYRYKKLVIKRYLVINFIDNLYKLNSIVFKHKLKVGIYLFGVL